MAWSVIATTWVTPRRVRDAALSAAGTFPIRSGSSAASVVLDDSRLNPFSERRPDTAVSQFAGWMIPRRAISPG